MEGCKNELQKLKDLLDTKEDELAFYKKLTNFIFGGFGMLLFVLVSFGITIGFTWFISVFRQATLPDKIQLLILAASVTCGVVAITTKYIKNWSSPEKIYRKYKAIKNNKF